MLKQIKVITVYLQRNKMIEPILDHKLYLEGKNKSDLTTFSLKTMMPMIGRLRRTAHSLFPHKQSDKWTVSYELVWGWSAQPHLLWSRVGSRGKDRAALPTVEQ